MLGFVKVLGSLSLFENKKTFSTGIRQVLLDHGFCEKFGKMRTQSSRVEVVWREIEEVGAHTESFRDRIFHLNRMNQSVSSISDCVVPGFHHSGYDGILVTKIRAFSQQRLLFHFRRTNDSQSSNRIDTVAEAKSVSKHYLQMPERCACIEFV